MIRFGQDPGSTISISTLDRDPCEVNSESLRRHATVWRLRSTYIALSDPQMGLDKIVRAAKLACIHDEIVAMPMG